MSFDRVSLQISGIKGPDQYAEIEHLTGFLYKKGTDPHLFVDMPLEQAQLAQAQINSTPGLHAEIQKWR